MSSQTHNNHYYVPNPVAYPVILSAGLLALAAGFIFNINNLPAGKGMMIAGALVILGMIFKWMGSVIAECQNGLYTKWEDKSFRVGMIVFICSEVAFFAAFFGALFFMRVISIASWPSAGPGGVVLGKDYVVGHLNPMEAWGLPAVNTLILLTSGATVTWAHWGLLKNNRKQLVIGLFLTVALGISFLACQAVEYHHAYTEMGLTLGSGAYGASFFMLTGFHGFHVMLGTLMLIVILVRSMKGHFDADHHFGFEGVAWYWHFVDVVWLGLFVFVYWL